MAVELSWLSREKDLHFEILIYCIIHTSDHRRSISHNASHSVYLSDRSNTLDYCVNITNS